MSERHVVVVGSGAAGTAAALAAREAGARVTLVRGRTGATSLGCGALDVSGLRPPAARGSGDDVAGVPSLELFALGPCRLATSAGTLRDAAGRNRALADLGATKGPVLVARVAHPAWDADALAAAWSEEDSRGFVARDVGLVMHTEERVMQHAELAALHDDPARLARAAERIRAALGAGGELSAVVLPPWLGVEQPRSAELAALVGLPCGEALVPFDGPSGLRFERARNRYLQNANVTTVAGMVDRVASSGRCTVEVGGATLEADAVVLATGGLLGAIEYTPGDAADARAIPPPGHAPFALAYDAPVTLGRDGRPLVVPGSIFGVPPESLTWPARGTPALESVGILAGADLRAAPNVYVCGDAVEGRPRTMLAALATGAAAGRAAARA